MLLLFLSAKIQDTIRKIQLVAIDNKVEATAILEPQQFNIETKIDCIGMNPFHIVALSQKPSIENFEEMEAGCGILQS